VMWTGLEGHYEEAERRVREALEAFHASRYDHNDGQDGPDDADEEAAASSIHAAECYVKGDVQSASWAAARAVDVAFGIARAELQLDPNDFLWDPSAEPIPFAKEAMHSAVQSELKRQLADLELLAGKDLSSRVLRLLRQ
jgi:hypothetical protein